MNVSYQNRNASKDEWIDIGEKRKPRCINATDCFHNLSAITIGSRKCWICKTVMVYFYSKWMQSILFDCMPRAVYPFANVSITKCKCFETKNRPNKWKIFHRKVYLQLNRVQSIICYFLQNDGIQPQSIEKINDWNSVWYDFLINLLTLFQIPKMRERERRRRNWMHFCC